MGKPMLTVMTYRDDASVSHLHANHVVKKTKCLVGSRIVAGNFWDEAERDRLGAWVLSGVVCMTLQRVFILTVLMIWFIPSWSLSMPFPHAVVLYWKGHAYFSRWGDVIVLGAMMGVVGYIAQQRYAEKRLFGDWRTLLACAMLIVLIEGSYSVSLSSLRTGEVKNFMDWLRFVIEKSFHYITLARLGVLVVALRLIPEVASGLEQIFTVIRERYLS